MIYGLLLIMISTLQLLKFRWVSAVKKRCVFCKFQKYMKAAGEET